VRGLNLDRKRNKVQGQESQGHVDQKEKNRPGWGSVEEGGLGWEGGLETTKRGMVVNHFWGAGELHYQGTNNFLSR